MKRRAFLEFLAVPLAAPLEASTTMTITQAEAEAKLRWGLNGRLRETWIPKPTGTGWTILYQVGVQEYQQGVALGSDFFGPEHALANANAGKPLMDRDNKLPEMTPRGSGSSWAKAFEAAGTR